MAKIKSGDRVKSLEWANTTGRVIRVEDDCVYVRWDGSWIEDERHISNVKKL